MKKNWRVWYFGIMGASLCTGRIRMGKAKRLFKTLESAFAIEKVSGLFKRKIYKEGN